MHAHGLIDLVEIKRLEVGFPETVLELQTVGVAAFVESLYDFNCFHIGETKFLALHLFNEEADVFLLAEANAGIQTAEDGAHAILSSVSTDVGLQFGPSERVEVTLFGEVVQHERYELGGERRVFVFYELFIDVEEALPIEAGDMKRVVEVHGVLGERAQFGGSIQYLLLFCFGDVVRPGQIFPSALCERVAYILGGELCDSGKHDIIVNCVVEGAIIPQANSDGPPCSSLNCSAQLGSSESICCRI